MRRHLLAVGVVCAAAGLAHGQFGAPANGTGGGSPVMPGQAVGTGCGFPSAGNPVPKAAPPAGTPLGSGLSSRPYDPSRPLDVFKGTGIDPKSVVAPIMPMGMKEPNLLDRLYDKLGAVTGFRRPDAPAQANYTPGISRRNRERAENRMWRRD